MISGRRVPGWRGAAAIAAALLGGQAAVLALMGRRLWCACGRLALWHGGIDGETSQQLLDWYSASHVIHGLLLFWATRVAARRRPLRARLLAAMMLEIAWELVENSPAVIRHYRMTAMALGYAGDSVVNSLADVGCMTAGFLLASRLPWWGGLLLAIALEVAAYAAIGDNLLLSATALVRTLV